MLSSNSRSPQSRTDAVTDTLAALEHQGCPLAIQPNQQRRPLELADMTGLHPQNEISALKGDHRQQFRFRGGHPVWRSVSGSEPLFGTRHLASNTKGSSSIVETDAIAQCARLRAGSGDLMEVRR